MSPNPSPLTPLAAIGEWVVKGGLAIVGFLAFLGELLIVIAQVSLRPHRWRVRSAVNHMWAAGVAALPIVGLLSFLIGVVTAYQGAAQLARFGAEIFIVNVIGVGVLREMGALIAAIVVAGRSASAFAAQIGSMNVNEEVDALKTMNIDPVEILVVPRVIGLFLIFPFIVFFSDMMGILGGLLMSTVALNITVTQFATQFQHTVPLSDLWVGLSKAPLFAFTIAMIGCFQGLSAARSAESVGQKTTAAVVQSIFLVIAIDAVLSVLYAALGI